MRLSRIAAAHASRRRLPNPAILFLRGTQRRPQSLSALAASFSTADSPAEGIDGKLQAQILGRCEELHAAFVQPLNDRLYGPLEKNTSGGYKTTKLPFVFLLGNHSSGKSSFINYVLGRAIQTAGVAPTDDSFTIIAPGPTDMDQDGPALVGDPDMGFAGLRGFGPTLIHHTRLKVRSDIATSAFMMVDSPGMIDSPVQRSAYEDTPARGLGANPFGSTSGPAGAVGAPQFGAFGGSARRGSLMDRGYDFEGVVRWFAERADVILLFFDPDKPGTTGETLSILTNSLPGMDHKLYIILNKADQFEKIHDFARAYGSLCWNLSKVITRKDLPRIYTMCLPVKERYRWQGYDSTQHVEPLGQGLQDLETTRDEVTAEVMKAPKRRIDNVITRLTDSVHLLQVHATILDALQRDYHRSRLSGYASVAAAAVLGAGASGAALYLGAPVEATAAVGALGGVGAVAAQFWNARALAEKEQRMLRVEGLDATFHRCYARELADGDEFTNAMWRRIRDGLRLSLTTVGLGSMPRVKPAELKELQRILEKEIPDLRRKAAPAQFSFFGNTKAAASVEQ